MCIRDRANSLILMGVFGADSASVDILEDLIETELSKTLSGVSNKGWEPSLHKKVSN